MLREATVSSGRIGEVEARPDPMVLKRGRLRHSGVNPDPARLSTDPVKGRLTLNLFLFES